MKNKMKIIFGQTVLVAFLILAEFSIQGIAAYVSGEDSSFAWYMPLAVIGVSFLSSVPTLLLYINTSSKAKWIALVVAHYLLVTTIVMSCGYLIEWYSTAPGFFITFATCTVIYVIVWVATTLMYKHDAKVINSALGDIRDEE